jgi:CheY-like chemotaxis protein
MSWCVLIAEDLNDDAQMLSKILTFHGMTVLRAHNGQECLDIAQRERPDAIITDLAMPVCDGWRMLSTLRSQTEIANIPVIAVTAYHSANLCLEALEAGFDGCCPKPLSPLDFPKQLRKIVEAVAN